MVEMAARRAEISKIRHLELKRRCLGPSGSKVASFWCIICFLLNARYNSKDEVLDKLK